ncbi:MAG: HPr family phosphocarrier protein [Oscillospiraceae bacterium]
MEEIKVTLGSIEAVKEFVALTNSYPFDIDLVSGRYAVDAKSIMGIFSLDLSKALTLVVHADGAESEPFLEMAAKFAAK